MPRVGGSEEETREKTRNSQEGLYATSGPEQQR